MADLFDKETQLDRIEAKLDLLLAPKKKRTKKTAPNYSDDFESMWKLYPKREGSNPKNTAYEAWCARLKERKQTGVTVHQLLGGMVRYKKHCEANRTAPKYIMQVCTFFGPGMHFLEEWKVSTHTIRESIPKADDDLGAFAVKHGMHQPGQAPQNIVNNGQYRTWIQERL